MIMITLQIVASVLVGSVHRLFVARLLLFIGSQCHLSLFQRSYEALQRSFIALIFRIFAESMQYEEVGLRLLVG